MTLDELIKQYEWPWETSIDLIRKDIDCYTIYAFSIKYYEETGEVETRYLQIKGKFKIVEKEVADEKDMFVSLANINKHLTYLTRSKYAYRLFIKVEPRKPRKRKIKFF